MAKTSSRRFGEAAGARWALALGLRGLGLAAVLAAFAHPAVAACDPPPPAYDAVVLTTTLGTMRVDLFRDEAPNTVENFLCYVTRGEYDGVMFHRSVPGFVVQAGGFRYTGADFESIDRDDPIANEFGLSNERGTLAMAKFSGDPDSATSEWFINLDDNGPILDGQNGGFTVFGKVREADMAVADAIAALPILDARLTLSTDLREIFRELPITSAVDEDPAGYGCFDFTLSNPSFPGIESTGALYSLDPLGPVADPVTGGPILISPECIETTLPAIPCDAPNSLVAAFNYQTDQVLTNGMGGVFAWCMDPDDVDASDASVAARNADYDAQVPSRLVQITSVPEPRAVASQAASVLGLAWLARRRLRTRHADGARTRPARA